MSESYVYNYPTCDKCGEPKVDIYHDSGSWCLECWSKITEPYNTPTPSQIDRTEYWRNKLVTGAL